MSFKLELNGELNGLNGHDGVVRVWCWERKEKVLTLSLKPVIEALLGATLDPMDIFLDTLTLLDKNKKNKNENSN